MSDGLQNLRVACGQCGGDVYFHTCPDHDWVVMGVCQGCLVVHRHGQCEAPGCHYSDADVLPKIDTLPGDTEPSFQRPLPQYPADEGTA